MLIIFNILIILFAVLIAFLLALFLLKIRFLIDTEAGVFEINQRPLYRVNVLTDPNNPAKVKFRILGVPFTLDFLKMNEKRKKKKRSESISKAIGRRNRSSKKSSAFSMKSFKTILNTIKVKQLAISIDTGDFTVNAQLFPLVYILNQHVDDRYSFEINFIDENALKLRLETRPIWVSIALIRLKTKQLNISKNGSKHQ